MPILTVQLNHPGAELPYKMGKGFSVRDGKVVREWNAAGSHHRKFIRSKGEYLSQHNAQPIKGSIMFWGEWEGNAWYTHVGGAHAYGIHEPFFSLQPRNHQNTDPYVFGPAFRYAVCKQRGRMHYLEPGSLILFGSSFGHGFALDTMMVVGSYQTAQEVSQTNASHYSDVYRQTTLEQLGATYLGAGPDSRHRLYSGKTWHQDPTFFSYTPCKPDTPDNAQTFPRVMFPFEGMQEWGFSSNPTGIKFISEGAASARNIWQTITEHVLSQGYSLGISIEEPR
jgi:hypothetical protein